jgi:YegS/Rv2252/BmrU family lipid kinase
MRLLFIMNPSSGRSSNDEATETIKNTMADRGLDFTIFHTTGENDVQHINTELKELRPEVAVACGGDGTVQLVARALIGKNIHMGILPLGSANGLAKALGIPEKVEDALGLIISNVATVPLDILQVNGHVCVHLCDIGINALLVKNYEESGDKGMIGYAKHLMPSIRESERLKYTIRTPEETFEEEGYMLMIANADRYGTGVKISDGSVSDGKFEISSVKQVDFPSAVKAGLTALNVFVDRNMFSDVISCTRAEITLNSKAHMQIDGEYIGEVDHINVEIIPSAFSIRISV